MKLQCKHLSTFEILLFIYVRCKREKKWGNNCFNDDADIKMHLFDGIPNNLFYAKMYQLIHKGYLDGCWCGCRGDYEITAKGEAYLRKDESNYDNSCGFYMDFIGYEIDYEPTQIKTYLKQELIDLITLPKIEGVKQ